MGVSLVFVGLLYCSLVFGGESDVIQLTDDNFEHDTQVATGATTGDWFIKL